MTKKELIAAVSAKANVSVKDTAAVIDSLLTAITEIVADGERVRLTGFGVFAPQARKARVGRNPATGAAVEIPAVTVPSFKPSTAFKNAVKK